MTSFVNLINFSFRHEYYLSDGMPVEVIPTPTTQALLHSGQCVFKTQKSGFYILVQVGKSGANALQALFECEPEAEFKFNVRAANQTLYNFTKPLVDPDLTKQEEHTFADAGELREFWKQNKEVKSRVIYRIQNNVVGKTVYPVPETMERQLTHETICAITIPLSEFDITPFQQNYIPKKFDLVLPFESRKTRWRYTISLPGLSKGNVGIVDSTKNSTEQVIFEQLPQPGELSDTPGVDASGVYSISFISKQTIPLKSRTQYRFSLIEKNQAGEHERTLIDRLPMAGIHNFSKDPQNDSDLVSDIYIS